MTGRFPFAAFAARLPEDRRDVFAAFAGAKCPSTVIAHIRSQEGAEVPRAAPYRSWFNLR